QVSILLRLQGPERRQDEGQHAAPHPARMGDGSARPRTLRPRGKVPARTVHEAKRAAPGRKGQVAPRPSGAQGDRDESQGDAGAGFPQRSANNITPSSTSTTRTPKPASVVRGCSFKNTRTA